MGFCGILHFPHPTNKKIKRVSRLVILPDYQGIGLGRGFLNFIAEKYVSEGWSFSITTSAKNLISALARDKDWSLVRYGKVSETGNAGLPMFKKTSSEKRVTASFFRKEKL